MKHSNIIKDEAVIIDETNLRNIIKEKLNNCLSTLFNGLQLSEDSVVTLQFEDGNGFTTPSILENLIVKDLLLVQPFKMRNGKKYEIKPSYCANEDEYKKIIENVITDVMKSIREPILYT